MKPFRPGLAGTMPFLPHLRLTLFLILGLSLLAATRDADACALKCQYNQDCYNCIAGGRLDDCFLDCHVCGGTRCLPGAAPEPLGVVPPSPDPLQSLRPFPTSPLAREIHPAVARVFDWFWRWHDRSPRAAREAIDLSGSVVVEGKPSDFALAVRQEAEKQVYSLEIVGLGKVTLTVNPASAVRQELEYEFQREGEARAGSIMLEVD